MPRRADWPIYKFSHHGDFSPDLHIRGRGNPAFPALVTLALVADFADFRGFRRFSRIPMHHFRAGACGPAALA
jgi:hypothetical protein